MSSLSYAGFHHLLRALALLSLRFFPKVNYSYRSVVACDHLSREFFWASTFAHTYRDFERWSTPQFALHFFYQRLQVCEMECSLVMTAHIFSMMMLYRRNCIPQYIYSRNFHLFQLSNFFANSVQPCILPIAGFSFNRVTRSSICRHAYSRSAISMSSVIVDPSIGITVLPMRFRKATKQLATLGPASSSFEMIEKLFLSGRTIYSSLL